MIIFQGGGLDAMSAILGQRRDTGSPAFQRLLADAGDTVTAFYDRSLRMKEAAFAKVREVGARIRSFTTNNIPLITSPGDLLHVNKRTARYLLASPELRRRFLSGTASGFGIGRKTIPKHNDDDPYYCSVMDGRVIYEPGSEDGYSETFLTLAHEDGLTDHESDNVFRMWEIAAAALNEGNDITDY